MRAVALPPGDAPALWRRLYEEFRVELPVFEWNERRLLSVSIGPDNDEEDITRLIEAREQLL